MIVTTKGQIIAAMITTPGLHNAVSISIIAVQCFRPEPPLLSSLLFHFNPASRQEPDRLSLMLESALRHLCESAHAAVNPTTRLSPPPPEMLHSSSDNHKSGFKREGSPQVKDEHGVLYSLMKPFPIRGEQWVTEWFDENGNDANHMLWPSHSPPHHRHPSHSLRPRSFFSKESEQLSLCRVGTVSERFQKYTH